VKVVVSVVRFAMALLLAFVAILLLTGLFVSPSSGIHMIAGHGFVIALWVLAPAAIGVSVSEAIRCRRWLWLIHAVAVLFLLGAGILAAFTGYLPTVPGASAETRLRFIVLHQITFPFFVALLAATWVILSRKYARPGA
jgi:hypothetical protein